MPIWPKKCNKMLWMSLNKAWRNITSRKTSLLTSRKSLTRSTTPLGIALLAETLAATSLMRPNISSISTWDKWPFFCSNLDKLHL
ncbi:UNVERIFIED_CONTAM: hypothetical protein GTU68_015407 [Idotea baltica]|nr:hypothetical protein [Idotea baltica]